MAQRNGFGFAEGILPDLRMSDVLQQRPSALGSVWQALRITVAVLVSWLLADAFSQSTLGIFAPVTTLLVVSASPWSTVGLSAQRILGTGVGVLAASVWVNLVGVTWWSIALAVFAALLVARLLPMSLSGQFQIPVAVVFVLAIGPGTLDQDLWRVIDVALGGAVGLLAIYLPPPRPHPERFEQALGAYREAIIDVLHDVADECGTHTTPLGPAQMHEFVRGSRALRGNADDSRQALTALNESVQLNPRGRRVRPELADDAVRFRLVSGIGLQTRGIAGAAHRLYDRDGDPPLLRPLTLRGVIEELIDVLRLALGETGEPVGTASPDRLEVAVERLDARLRALASSLSSDSQGAGDALESISLLGRLQLVAAQAGTFHLLRDPDDETGEPA